MVHEAHLWSSCLTYFADHFSSKRHPIWVCVCVFENIEHWWSKLAIELNGIKTFVLRHTWHETKFYFNVSNGDLVNSKTHIEGLRHWMFCSRSNRQAIQPFRMAFFIANCSISMEKTRQTVEHCSGKFTKYLDCSTCSLPSDAKSWNGLHIFISLNGEKTTGQKPAIQKRKRFIQTNRVSVRWAFCVFTYISVVVEKQESHWTIPVGRNHVLCACWEFCFVVL